MSRRSVFRWFVSAPVTVALLALLALLLLLNVVLPQERIIGEEQFAELVGRSVINRFVLDDLGLGSLRTSPIFLAALVLFFLNLAAVIAARVVPTWHRVSLKARSEAGLRAWARMEESVSEPLPGGWHAGHVARTLIGHGYVVRRPGKSTFWAVKHRTAPLGFLLFHLSFFLLCAGGVLVYYTRFVGLVTLSEGQEFDGEFARVQRLPPSGRAPEIEFAVGRIETRRKLGEPVHLGAEFTVRQAGASRRLSARVNHPARWGSTSLLVQQAGLAPVLWLQDGSGYTLDRVVTPVRAEGGRPTTVELAGGRWVAAILPLDMTVDFPARDELGTTSLSLGVTAGEEALFQGPLRPGEAAALGEARLVLEEIRYWVRVQVVRERGGGLLIAGFALGVLGLIWRLLWYRREVALTWDEEAFRLVGRSEFFSDRFQEELRAIARDLAGAPEEPGGRA